MCWMGSRAARRRTRGRRLSNSGAVSSRSNCKIEGEAGKGEGVGDEELCLEARRGESVFCEMAGGGFEDAQKGHTIAI